MSAAQINRIPWKGKRGWAPPPGIVLSGAARPIELRDGSQLKNGGDRLDPKKSHFLDWIAGREGFDSYSSPTKQTTLNQFKTRAGAIRKRPRI